MSVTQPAAQTEVSPSELRSVARIYAVVLSVGVCCGLAIVTVYELTKPIIARNRVEVRQRAILDVLPQAKSSLGFVWNQSAEEFQRVESEDAASQVIFAGYDEQDRLVGMAIETQGMGYQDFIRIIYGYSPHDQTVIGLRVLESRETPGLGDRIEKDANFVSNFAALDVAVEGDVLAHPIEFVKPGEKTDPWQIDGITGATISSKATADMLDVSTRRWMPRIQSHLGDFEFKRSGATDRDDEGQQADVSSLSKPPLQARQTRMRGDRA